MQFEDLTDELRGLANISLRDNSPTSEGWYVGGFNTHPYIANEELYAAVIADAF